MILAIQYDVTMSVSPLSVLAFNVMARLGRNKSHLAGAIMLDIIAGKSAERLFVGAKIGTMEREERISFRALTHDRKRRRLYCEPIAGKIADSMKAPISVDTLAQGFIDTLPESGLRRTIARFVIAEMSGVEIAEKLKVSEMTVSRELKEIRAAYADYVK